MKNSFILFIFLIAFTSYSAQNENYLKEKSLILKNKYETLKKFSEIANIIDSDSESYWAYKYADSTLTTIDKSGKNYYKDLTKIYSAYSHIFYGMSYTRTVMSISRGGDYSLEELNKTIIKPFNKTVDLPNLSETELKSIYSIINFYKVSRMQRYNNMNDLFKKNILKNESIFKNASKEQAYKIASFNNKKLFFMIFAGLIIDIYTLNNKGVDDTIYNNYMQNILKLGEKMDEIPSDNTKIMNLKESEYYLYLLKSSEVQKSMLKLLINEINVLQKRN
ncbi:hypothetical protein MPF19_16545 [Polaribacter sp. Z014]|uniref:hypothetical protein n=1 Tax=Polaribacter sp. Z014 TaxID=2927126 RepID=UPI0020209405|nr:hypothetical protein [Polaribacter sp. Z014]MCL7765034.1 hypothetical protein [Polaribacter sp. Z014]